MADYAQNGVIGTLHNLRNKSTEQLESELREYSQESPMTLLLPLSVEPLPGPLPTASAGFQLTWTTVTQPLVFPLPWT